MRRCWELFNITAYPLVKHSRTGVRYQENNRALFSFGPYYTIAVCGVYQLRACRIPHFRRVYKVSPLVSYIALCSDTSVRTLADKYHNIRTRIFITPDVVRYYGANLLQVNSDVRSGCFCFIVTPYNFTSCSVIQ